MSRRTGAAGRLAAAFIRSPLTPLFIAGAIALGAFAVAGAAARRGTADHRADDRRVRGDAGRLRRPRSSSASPGRWRSCSGRSPASSTSTPRRARVARWSRPLLRRRGRTSALVRLNQKLASNMDRIPPGASAPLVKPRSIDDVPILAMTLWGERYDDHRCDCFAASCATAIKEVPDVSEVTIIGGRRAPGARRARSRSGSRLTASTRSIVQQAIAPRTCAPRRRPGRRRQPRRRCRAGRILETADDLERVVVGPRAAAADLARATSPRSSTATRGRRPTSRFHTRERVVSGGHASRRQAQGHERHRRRAIASSTSSSCCAAPCVPRRRQSHDHAQLRRDRRREVERAAVSHVARRALGLGC